MPVPPLRVRRAEPADLAQAFEVFYENEVHGEPSPHPPIGPVPPVLRHVAATGDLFVAERAGRVVGFAGAVPRGNVAYLSDLFVRPGDQSAGAGAALLSAALPHDGRPRWTLASTDPRALALYTRSGMRPLWPNVELLADPSRGHDLRAEGVEAVEAAADDPALLDWDAEIGGRRRPQDHAFWAAEEGGVPLWFRRGREVVGHGWVRLAVGTVWTPHKATVGPVGARDPADARDCLLAAVAWARPRAAILDLALPGPHPALAPLLEAGFRIVYVETFCAGDDGPTPDPRRYAGSGGDLF